MQTSIHFAPAKDQTAVSHFLFTVEKATDYPDGGLVLDIVSGNVATGLRIGAMPSRPSFAVGAEYYFEYPRDGNPFTAPITAIYPKHLKPKSAKENAMTALVPAAATVTPVTLSSIELVDYINSQRKEGEPELLHKNFLAKVLIVLGENTSAKFLADLPDAYGRPRKGYCFPKREACLMAMSYSYELQAAVFDKMTALEMRQAQQPAIPQTLPEALRLAADLAEDNAQLAHQVKALAPKAEALDRIATADGSLCITNAAKSLSVPPKKLFDWLKAHHWIYRRAGGSSWTAYQGRIQSGVLEHKITTVSRSDGSEKVVEQVLVTAKGITKLSGLVASAAV